MNKTTQDLAWNCLPKEFKEEVKEDYNYAILNREYTKQQILENLFGIHNLTSEEEEEEDETLCVRRKEVQGLFSACNRYKHKCFIDGDSTDYLDGEINILTILFGSKYLPIRSLTK